VVKFYHLVLLEIHASSLRNVAEELSSKATDARVGSAFGYIRNRPVYCSYLLNNKQLWLNCSENLLPRLDLVIEFVCKTSTRMSSVVVKYSMSPK